MYIHAQIGTAVTKFDTVEERVGPNPTQTRHTTRPGARSIYTTILWYCLCFGLGRCQSGLISYQLYDRCSKGRNAGRYVGPLSLRSVTMVQASCRVCLITISFVAPERKLECCFYPIDEAVYLTFPCLLVLGQLVVSCDMNVMDIVLYAVDLRPSTPSIFRRGDQSEGRPKVAFLSESHPEAL